MAYAFLEDRPDIKLIIPRERADREGGSEGFWLAGVSVFKSLSTDNHATIPFLLLRG